MTNTADRITGARRTVVIAIIVSLVVTAVIGIVALLTGTFGDVQARVLQSTLLVAGFSLTTLCHLAVARGALRILGYIGIVASLLAAAAGTNFIWTGFAPNGQGELLKTFGILAVWAFCIAHANLLLVLGVRQRAVVRVALVVTLLSIFILGVLLTVAVAGVSVSEGFWRGLGVIAIIDVFGSIVLPILGKVFRDDKPASITSAGSRPSTDELLAAAAAERGNTPEAMLKLALDAATAAHRKDKIAPGLDPRL